MSPLVRRPKRPGFDQIWVSNDLFLRSAPVILQAVAHATQRIEVGTGILNPYTIHPAEIAMLAATMDEATGNRFNLGLAAGAGEFLKWVGIETAQPLAASRASRCWRSAACCAANAWRWRAVSCGGAARHTCVSLRRVPRQSTSGRWDQRCWN